MNDDEPAPRSPWRPVDPPGVATGPAALVRLLTRAAGTARDEDGDALVGLASFFASRPDVAAAAASEVGLGW